MFHDRLLSQHDIGLTQALQGDPLHSDLLEKVRQSSPLHQKIMERTSSLQVSFCSESTLCLFLNKKFAVLFL